MKTNVLSLIEFTSDKQKVKSADAPFPSTTLSLCDSAEAAEVTTPTLTTETPSATGKRCPEFRKATCPGSESRSESCRRAGRRRAARWRLTRRFGATEVGEGVGRIGWAGSGSESGNILQERIETFLEAVRLFEFLSGHKRLQKQNKKGLISMKKLTFIKFVQIF